MKVVSYNVCCLPNFFNMFGDPLKRIDGIIKQLEEINADVICIQEIFDKNIISIAKKKFSKYYIYYNDSTSYFKINNGLMIISKTPLFKSGFEIFKDYCGEDSLSEKGFIFSLTIIKNKGYLIINTHLNADALFSTTLCCDVIRKQQLDQLYNFISNNKKENIILCGDFNINFFKNKNTGFLDLFNFQQKEQIITLPYLKNQFDYILCRFNKFGNKKPEAKQKSKPKSFFECKKYHNLSDHNPIIFCLNSNE